MTVGPAGLDGVVFNMALGIAFTTSVGATFSTPGALRLIGHYSTATNPYIYTRAYSTNGAFVGTGSSNAALLGLGDPIGPSQNFVREVSAPFPNYGYYANLSNWSAGERGFVGIRFDLGADLHYGWADITRDASDVVTLHAFGYDDTPDAISSAGVPEPSSTMLLAAGAAGLGMSRRRKRTG